MSQPTAILKIASRDQADELIRDIRQAVKNSARTGGGYGVYRRDDNGDYAVAIEVNIVQPSAASHQHSAKARKGFLWNSLSSCSS